jgi:hypothetical protein
MMLSEVASHFVSPEPSGLVFAPEAAGAGLLCGS